MNKQELIESISHLPSDCSRPRPMIDKLTALELIKLLDEPQKVTVPQFVADYIKYAIENDWDFQDLFKRIEDEEDEETLAAAWINGYTVEKEKQYIVKMSATKQLLFYNNMYEKIFFSLGDLATRFTRKQLEGLGLGWVFDCEGIEIEEVE